MPAALGSVIISQAAVQHGGPLQKKLGANALTPFPGELRTANGMGLQVSKVVPVSVTDEVSGSLHKLSLLVARDLSAPVLLDRD
ncbi:hypothetical protein PR048_028398 [Dryococelus australis]|uniref:Uncharacterized protein n=1 Tax=Dryococelus australis TaxID=614101 RepID=A0ABQ9GAG4_9NEOP|nr:hypothetical protein PR048_028398 [Dryococelus australis]